MCIHFFSITECVCFIAVPKPTITVVRNLQDILASVPVSNYEFSTVSTPRRTHTQPKDIVYATVTVADLHQSQNELANENTSNPNKGVQPYDFTVIYADPTSSSYVVGVSYTGFRSIPIPCMYSADIYIHCSQRYTPVEVCLTLLGRMYLHWYAIVHFNALQEVVCWHTVLQQHLVLIYRVPTTLLIVSPCLYRRRDLDMKCQRHFTM